MSFASLASFLGPYRDRRMLLLLGLGFSSGLPILLIGSTLSLWLQDSGFSLRAIGLSAWLLFPYKVKFLWAPLTDQLTLPLLGRLGQRRGWLLLTQSALALSLLSLSLADPSADITGFMSLALLVATLSATQDIVIDGYRIELLPPEAQGAGAAAGVLGYRLGMVMAGGGALYFAAYFGWQVAYQLMAASMLIGIGLTLFAPEPERVSDTFRARDVAVTDDRPSLWTRLSRSLIEPTRELFSRPGAFLFLLFIMLYRLGDALANRMSNPFLAEIGFSKEEIALVAKTFGVVASIVGVLVGGWLVRALGVLRALWVGGLLQAISNLAFTAQALAGPALGLLFTVEAIYQITGGVAMAALVAYLSNLSKREASATDYALLSAISGVLNMALSGLSGWGAEALGWPLYFAATALTALPGLLLLALMRRWDMTGLRVRGGL